MHFSLGSIVQIMLTLFLSISAPSSPPEKVTSGGITSTSVILVWQAPPLDSQNGMIRSYEIVLVEAETGTTLSYNTTETTITISSLHPYYVYECTVAAVTDATGPFSDPLSIQTLPDGKEKLFCARSESLPFMSRSWYAYTYIQLLVVRPLTLL